MNAKDHGFMISLVLMGTGSLLGMDLMGYHARCILDGYSDGDA